MNIEIRAGSVRRRFEMGARVGSERIEKRMFRKIRFSSFLVSLVVVGASMGSRTASAATITVNTTDGTIGAPGCGLAEAVIAVNRGAAYEGCPAGNGVSDTIVVPATATSNSSRVSVQQPMVIQRSVIIRGSSVLSNGITDFRNVTRIGFASPLTARSGALFVVQNVGNPLTVEFHDLVLRATSDANTSAISAVGNSTPARVEVRRCELVNFTGGGIRSDGISFGVHDSIIRLGSGGGISLTGGVGVSLDVSNSLIAQTGGIGIDFAGGGASSIINTTITQNTGASGAGVNLSNARATVTIIASTIAFNSASASGGGVQASWFHPAYVEQSIIANNQARAGGPDWSGRIAKLTNSILGSDRGTTIGPMGAGNQINVDPRLLSRLVYAGGQWRSLVLRPALGSPAIDSLRASAVPEDQRHFPRGAQGGTTLGVNRVDVGAYEHDIFSQAELLPVVGKSSDAHAVVFNPAFSNGAAQHFNANAVGDFVTYSVTIPDDIPDAKVRVRALGGPSSGAFRLEARYSFMPPDTWITIGTQDFYLQNSGIITRDFVPPASAPFQAHASSSEFAELSPSFRFTAVGPTRVGGSHNLQFDWMQILNRSAP